MKSKQLITVIGNIGSGKTTVSPVIAKKVKARLINADNLFQTVNPFRDYYLKDNKRWALTNELWMTLARVKLLEKKLKESRAERIVIDSGLLMSWAYTYSHFAAGNLNKKEWQFYRKLFDRLAGRIFKKSMVISLECKVSTLMKRIEKRGRGYELKYYTPKYLRQINKGINKLKQKLYKHEVKVIEIKECEVAMSQRGKIEMKKVLASLQKMIS